MTGDDDIALALAAPGDCGRIAAIVSTGFESAWSPRSIAELLTLPGTGGLLARPERGRGPAIGVCLFRVAADEAEILSLAVLPGWRCRGVGAALLDRSLSICRDAGVVAVFLEVAVDNAAASALYRSRRFAVVGRREAYYETASGAVDAMIMRHRIQQ